MEQGRKVPSPLEMSLGGELGGSVHLREERKGEAPRSPWRLCWWRWVWESSLGRRTGSSKRPREQIDFLSLVFKYKSKTKR